MKIGVIGTGYVGLVTGACFAEIGNEVICADINEEKINLLRQGGIPIYEPGLEELVKRNAKENRLSFTTDIKKTIESAEVIFNAVGTPSGSDGNVDLSYVYAVAKSVGQYLNGYKVFVNKSTVPVGTSEKVGQIIAETSGNKYPFAVVDNPEFLREGSAIKDFMNPDRIVVGVEDDKAKKIMEQLYAPLVRTGQPLVFTDIKSAEIIKYASNAFLAVKISFINEIANFCEKVGGNIVQVAKGIGLDPRIGSRFLHAGIGWGGSCFPKDVQALIKTGESVDYQFKILKAAYDVNEAQKYLLMKKLKSALPSLENKVIALWGLSFKPKTDDIREAPSLIIINELLQAGALIQAFDPVATANVKKTINSDRITYFENPYEALEKADALLVLTEWDEFRSVDLAKMKKVMAGNLILDGRNIYEPDIVRAAGFKYEGIGR